MAVDLTGGLSDEREVVFPGQPENPEMRESVNAWVWDNGTEVATEVPDASERHQVAVAAALDLLWRVASYERLVTAWAMDPDEAIGVIGWTIEAVAEKAEAEPRRTKRHSTA